jgi:hypothetical protein
MPQNDTPSNEVAETRTLAGMFDFQTLMGEAAPEARGFRLVDQEALEGVPFVVVGVHIRDGVPQKTEKGKKLTNYLSIECVAADAVTLETLLKRKAISQGGRIVESLTDLGILPNENIVFNDGSTGVARQMVSLLHATGKIDVGDASKPNGPMGESSFDRYHGEWARGGRDMADANAPDPCYEGMPLLKAPRGLRSSDYVSEFGEAQTWYIG